MLMYFCFLQFIKRCSKSCSDLRRNKRKHTWKIDQQRVRDYEQVEYIYIEFQIHYFSRNTHIIKQKNDLTLYITLWLQVFSHVKDLTFSLFLHLHHFFKLYIQNIVIFFQNESQVNAQQNQYLLHFCQISYGCAKEAEQESQQSPHQCVAASPYIFCTYQKTASHRLQRTQTSVALLLPAIN